MENDTLSTSVPLSEQTSPLSGRTIGLVVLSLAFILGFPGNAFVIWSAACLVRKHTVTSLLILHLAVADGATLLTAPFFLRLLSIGQWEFGLFICQMCYYICGVCMYASVYLIVLMSLDRCLAVSKPFLSQNIRTKVVARSLVLVIWLLSFLLAIPVIFYRRLENYSGRFICKLSHDNQQHLVFHKLFEILTGCILPFFIIICCYIVIGHRLKETRFRRKRRTSRLITVIVVAFAVFWLPYHFVNILEVVGKLSGLKSVTQAGGKAQPTLIALAFFSSSINPILYTFTGSSLLKAAGVGFMAKLFDGTSSEIPSLRQGTGRSTQQREEVEMKVVRNENDENIAPTGLSVETTLDGC
ncbi:leukotriene B4 receptor 1 [Alligator sinensis]|uniref:Leukotriene B4 receptor 1 n=1 Tax=Alligator sinensis TaxID=38654 RepID=A0A1U7SAX1_ALLSI|nr:leukotriene B4 receptor 1 [Alligator sinensis]QKE59412.1 leukotriene B4 receptor 1 [Alligator sinensis]